MDMEDALLHALSLIDEESERLNELNEQDYCADWKWSNDTANDLLSELLALTRGGPANA
jgi:hypothetical protein